jgi:hypothetical protein
MRAAEVIAALALPENARVDQRVPKKLFLERGAPTAADKRALQDGIEEVQWIAALKPANIGVPTFRDEAREYSEIVVLAAILRPQANTARLTELIHRAIPYPLLLVTDQASSTTISLAHKRASLAEAGVVVVDGAVVSAPLGSQPAGPETAFLASLRLADQPKRDLKALYQGWIERLYALAAARLTGQFELATSDADAGERRTALGEHARLTRDIAGLRARAANESQISRRVELNLAIQRLEAERLAVTKKL